ncbi:hypothetical protein SEA_SALLYK_10 [Microbacterium phage SallyK]|nr:hypothetical protein SEA_SALLYK_10 [Microbacterium phage SallyK]
MTYQKTVPITIYTRVGDSEVLNDVGTFFRQVTAEKITPERRRPEDAPEATERILDIDLGGLLREAAEVFDV